MDGLSTLAECQAGTNPRDCDTDDGMPDGWELSHNLSPTSSTGKDGASGDPDADGLLNLKEFQLGADPRNSDTDGDAMPDGWEVEWGFDPTAAAGPDDPNRDEDEDGLSNLPEYQHGTNPRDGDTDHDGMRDGDEIFAGMNPLDPASLFGVLSVRIEQEGSLSVTWGSSPGRYYLVRLSLSLGTWVPVLPPIVAQSHYTTARIPLTPTVYKAFVRVELLP